MTYRPGWCERCQTDVVDGTACPRSVPCPRCGAGADRPCRRPSGHRADTLHAERIRAAEELDRANGINLYDGEEVRLWN